MVAAVGCAAGTEHPVAGGIAPPAAGGMAANAEVSVTTTMVPTPRGEFVVQGAILQKYLAYGGVTGALGVPTSGELAADNVGRYNTFAGGAIYWTPPTGAHVVWGRIREQWERSGGPTGPLGYPVTDEHSLPGGWESMFQHGIIAHTDGRTQVETR